MIEQVDKSHYIFTKYSHPGRWVSYFHQLKEVINLKPGSVLEIGVGDKVFQSFLRNNTEIKYASVDIASDLSPDFVAPVTLLPFSDASYDVVCAFEVLEHIPFEDFPKAVSELLRVSRGFVVLSLPHFGPPVQLFIKVPFFPKLKVSFKIPFHKRHKFDGEHYWEIGKSGYSVKNILQSLNTQGKVIKHFVPFENQYHHFFILKKKA